MKLEQNKRMSKIVFFCCWITLTSWRFLCTAYLKIMLTVTNSQCFYLTCCQFLADSYFFFSLFRRSPFWEFLSFRNLGEPTKINWTTTTYCLHPVTSPNQLIATATVTRQKAAKREYLVHVYVVVIEGKGCGYS